MKEKYWFVEVKGYVDQITQRDRERAETFGLDYQTQDAPPWLRCWRYIHCESAAYAADVVLKTVQGVFWESVWESLDVEVGERPDEVLPESVPEVRNVRRN